MDKDKKEYELRVIEKDRCPLSMGNVRILNKMCDKCFYCAGLEVVNQEKNAKCSYPRKASEI